MKIEESVFRNDAHPRVQPSHDEKFTTMFMLLAAYVLWTYSVMPDAQTTMLSIKSGVDKEKLAALWGISLIGTGVFFYALYKTGQLPAG